MIPTILIVRHAATQLDMGSDPKVQGWLPQPPTTAELQQFRPVAESLARTNPVQVIYASPMARAKITAQVLGQAMGAPVQEAPGLAAWNLGTLQGQSEEKIHTVLQQLRERFPATAPPGGEPFLTYKFRFLRFMQKVMVEARRGVRLACVTHSTNEDMLKAWLDAGMPPDYTLDEGTMRLGDVSETGKGLLVRFDGQTWRMSKTAGGGAVSAASVGQAEA